MTPPGCKSPEPIYRLPPINLFAVLAAPAQVGEQLRDIKDILPLEHAWPWWVWVAAAVLLFGAALICIFLLRSRKKTVSAPAMPPEQAALAELQQLHGLIQQQEGKQFAIAIADILRRYIESRFQVKAPSLTTREFFLHVTDPDIVLPQELSRNVELLTTLLQHCDMAKFACTPPTGEEMEDMLAQASAFIGATRTDKEAR